MQLLEPITKDCNNCMLAKPLDEFHNHKGGKFGKRAYCKECRAAIHEVVDRDRHIESQRLNYINNRESILERQKQDRLSDPERYKKYHQQSYVRNKESIKKSNNNYVRNNLSKVKANKHLYIQYIRALVFNHYGIICNSCGEDDFDTLEIDHINNDGYKHRRLDIRLYHWLLKNNFPDGFQTLCASCNFLKYKNNGVLPEYRLDFHNGEKSFIKIKLKCSYEQKLKDFCFNHYGKFCINCYENDINVLQFDHINNDGYKHRKESWEAKNICRYLVNNNFPDTIQVLCVNCNKTKHKNNGILPCWRKAKYQKVN